MLITCLCNLNRLEIQSTEKGWSPEGKNYEVFPGGSDGKASDCNFRYPGLIPGLGKSPGEGNGNPLQYYCPENSKDRGAWCATVHGVAKEATNYYLNEFKSTGRIVPNHLITLSPISGTET